LLDSDVHSHCIILAHTAISQSEYDSIWDLIESQLDQKLKSTSGVHEVQLM
jgi:hypothetical protein